MLFRSFSSPTLSLSLSLSQNLPLELLGPFFMEFIIGHEGHGKAICGEWCGKVGFDFRWVSMGF